MLPHEAQDGGMTLGFGGHGKEYTVERRNVETFKR
jgi:hypothetical protein